nr:MAG TPA: hypothetical protein [Caudoviricetes sp.]
MPHNFIFLRFVTLLCLTLLHKKEPTKGKLLFLFVLLLA